MVVVVATGRKAAAALAGQLADERADGPGTRIIQRGNNFIKKNCKSKKRVQILIIKYLN